MSKNGTKDRTANRFRSPCPHPGCESMAFVKESANGRYFWACDTRRHNGFMHPEDWTTLLDLNADQIERLE